MGQMIRMAMADGAEIQVYHAEPQGERRGGVVLVQEIFGVTDHIRDMADDYAGEGYEVLSPALFDREHPGFEADYSGPDFERAVELARTLQGRHDSTCQQKMREVINLHLNVAPVIRGLLWEGHVARLGG